MKKYNVELKPEAWKELRNYLINNGIKYEPAACYNLIYITIWCSDNQAENINNYLEVL